jgi:fibronectin-binding autotransporter adhesin
MPSRRLLTCAVFSAALALGAEASARTCTWKGSSTSFTRRANWGCSSGLGPPSSGDTLSFDGSQSNASCAISAGASLDSVTIASTYTGTVSLSGAATVSGALTVGGGTFSAGSGDLQVGSVSVSGGSVTLSSGSVAVTGDLALTGGTVTGGSGSIAVGGNVTVNDAVTNGADPDLVGYWPLDESSGSAADSSGNGNTLTWSATPSVITVVSSAISFADTRAAALTGTQYASSGALSGISALRPTTVTLSAWYKATSVDTNGAEIISGSNSYGLRITSTGAMVMKRISDNTAAADWIEYRVPISNVLDGSWHHLAGEIVPGTGGGMSLYFDGVVVSGTYWVNGSSGAAQLGAGTSPTATAAAEDSIDWDANTETYGLVIGNNPSTSGYHFGKGCSGTACAIDEVRVYDRALTAGQIAALAHGNQPGGTAGVLSLTGAMSVSGSVAVQSTGTLTLNSGSSLAVGSALTMDGTLNATSATIQRVSGRYAFKVGSTSSAAPTLNVDGLTVDGTDANGMWINADTGATTTFTRFDQVAFSNGTGSQLLQIYAPSLDLTSNGCSFDGSTTYAVKLTGNGTGGGAGPRALFGDATCATNDPTSGLCAASEKLDDDANNDGVADNPGTNGAVVQFIRGAASDTAGTLVGFPTAAFDWNTFTYYASYVAFHDASNGSDVIYVRDQAGKPLYSWVDPTADETITGTPQWTTTGGTHYLYVAVNGAASNTGKVYRLIDSGTRTTSGTLTLDTGWATSGAYSCGCTITSNLSMDASNLYWAATTSTAQVLMGLKQSTGAKISSGWPVTTPASVTTSSPTLVTSSGVTTLYLGLTADLVQLAVTGTTFVQNTKPGTITGRVTYGTSALSATSGTSRLYAGDSSGSMWAISPSNFTGTHDLWSYAAGSGITNNYYDASTDTLQFGTSGGKVVVLNAATGAVVNAGYPYTLDASDPITAAPLYNAGVLVVGTSKGKLYLLDRNTGTGASVIKTYSFGASQSVSTVAFDPQTSRYMVATSSAANDGRIYFLDLVSDPTPSSR